MNNNVWHKGNGLRRKPKHFQANSLGMSKKRVFYRIYKALKIKCLPNGWDSIIPIFLKKKMSKKLYLFWAIHQYSRRNIKESKNNIESYVQIKDMPNLLPLKEKNQIKSYGLVIKKMQEAQRVKKEAASLQVVSEKIA